MPLLQSKTESLRDQVRLIMSAEGLSFDELAKSASDVILFGSRTVGVNRPNSDWDLLIISDQSGHKKRGKLDLVFVPQTKVSSPIWRRTELARHIGAFGISLMHNDLRIDAIADEYAAIRKQARLQKLVKSLLPCWDALNEELRHKYLTRVRREVQRYRYLKEGAPVPPTANLDSILNSPDWTECVFEGIGDAANISKADAVRVYQVMADEARRISQKKKRSQSRSPRRTKLDVSE